MQTRPDALFAALADPTRRGIFERLAQKGEQSVVALTKEAGVSQPAVSKHLGILKGAALVADRRAARETHYRIEPKGLKPLVDWMTHYGAFRRDRLDKLEDLLKRMDQ